MLKRTNVWMGIAWGALAGAIGAASLAGADSFTPHPGWACEEANPSDTSYAVQVTYQGQDGGQDLYRLRALKGTATVALVERARQTEDAAKYVIAGSEPGTAVELTIRKFEGSDQDLSSSLKLPGRSGPTSLLCSRSRP